ncbi:(E)-4-hydroxy-3-methylbut-2-enyl-diphosphate synthase [bacterium]|nr:(E)-4-hydroxy-3-methylbut-2-enyl-diphosphate synthase [bacterium]
MAMPCMVKPISYNRRKTHPVWVGGIAVGGSFPIRVQSMCTSDTKNTEAVIREMEGLVQAGCEIIRVTVPTQADCDNLPNIRAAMKARGIKVPLVADIHFTPSIAMQVVEYVDKVRINPGNFVDKKLFKSKEYTDDEYAAELTRIREKFVPLVLKCQEHNVAMRIGTNHGSLSDRIMNRYGDTPLGMVESALEFLRIAEELNYRQIILSMKASNVQVMTEAYRLLASRLDQLGWHYPLHLGVTEAGEGEDGRIKSAIGIGSLLEDGLGDTIRVSLTEDSIYEVPVAYGLVQKYNNLFHDKNDGVFKGDDFHYARRSSSESVVGALGLGSHHPIRVAIAFDASNKEKFEKEYQDYLYDRSGLEMPLEIIEWQADDKTNPQDLVSLINRFHTTGGFRTKPELALVTSCVELIKQAKGFSKIVWLGLDHLTEVKELCKKQNLFLEVRLQESQISNAASLGVSSISLDTKNSVYAYRKLASLLGQTLINITLSSSSLLSLSISGGCLLNDGIGDSICLSGFGDISSTVRLSYNILQGARLRITKTEYISCPSCGRTLFDLQTTTDKIRQVTNHLKGVKIAVMGCIVNGPGEMADADFGYVGTGPKKVSLYVGKDCVERNIPEEEAVGSLVNLIKKHGRWVEEAQL